MHSSLCVCVLLCYDVFRVCLEFFFFSSRRRHTRCRISDWSSDVCSSDLMRRQEIADAIRGVDEGRGVIMLTDLFGGTPSNLAISLLEAGRTEEIGRASCRERVCQYV